MRVAVLVPDDSAISRLAAFARTTFSNMGHETVLVAHPAETLGGTFSSRCRKVGFWTALDETAYALFEGWASPWTDALTHIGLTSPAEFDAWIADTRSAEIGHVIRQISADLLVAIGCTQINISALPRGLIALNIHPGVLPRYKGVGSPEALILDRPKQVGYTIHRLTSRLDEGDVFLRKRQETLGGFNAPQLYLGCYLSAIKDLAINLDRVVDSEWPVADDFAFSAPAIERPLWRLTLSGVLIHKARSFCRSS